jgi:hypothetical protein
MHGMPLMRICLHSFCHSYHVLSFCLLVTKTKAGVQFCLYMQFGDLSSYFLRWYLVIMELIV